MRSKLALLLLAGLVVLIATQYASAAKAKKGPLKKLSNMKHEISEKFANLAAKQLKRSVKVEDLRPPPKFMCITCPFLGVNPYATRRIPIGRTSFRRPSYRAPSYRRRRTSRFSSLRRRRYYWFERNSVFGSKYNSLHQLLFTLFSLKIHYFFQHCSPNLAQDRKKYMKTNHRT